MQGWLTMSSNGRNQEGEYLGSRGGECEPTPPVASCSAAPYKKSQNRERSRFDVKARGAPLSRSLGPDASDRCKRATQVYNAPLSLVGGVRINLRRIPPFTQCVANTQ